MKPSGLPFKAYEARNKAQCDYAIMEINVMFGGFPGPLPRKVLKTPMNKLASGFGGSDYGFYDRNSANHWSRQSAEFRKKRLGL